MIRNSVLKRWGGAFGNASAEECNNREQKRGQCKRFKNGCVRDERNDEGNQISIGATCLVLTAIKQREKIQKVCIYLSCGVKQTTNHASY
jgi:hypothetical protein